MKVVQKSIDGLRELIQSSSFDHAFKERLLQRLETLQRELHKRMSSLDKFWGLFGDAGVAMGKFGNEAQPFFDRVRELIEVVWRTQARAEELPSDSQPPRIESQYEGSVDD